MKHTTKYKQPKRISRTKYFVF